MWMKWSKNRQLEVVWEWEYEWFSRVHAHILRTASHLVPHITERVSSDIENEWCFCPWHLVFSFVLNISNVGMSCSSKCLHVRRQPTCCPTATCRSTLDTSLLTELSIESSPSHCFFSFAIEIQQNTWLRTMLLTTKGLPLPANIYLSVALMFWLMIACFFQGKWLKTMVIKGRVTTVQLSPSQSVSMGRSLGLWITRPKLSDDPPPHPIPHAKESPQPARSASSPPASSSDPLQPSGKSPPGVYAHCYQYKRLTNAQWTVLRGCFMK